MALTFDDGVDEIETPKVLDILKKYNIKAIFFCIGERSKDSKLLLQRIVDEGHLVGNHSYSHSSTFPLFSRRKMLEDIEECHRVLSSAIGSELIYFRPPFGVTNPTIGYCVKRMNYSAIGWSIRSLDTTKRDRDTILKRVTKRFKNGAIILLHDRLKESDILLEKIIIEAHKRGFEFKRVDFI